MESFWIWLAQANARKVYLVALAVLVLATGYWTWKAYAPVATELLPPTGYQKAEPREEVGLLSILEKQLAYGVRVPDNLFLYSPGPRKPVYVVRPRPHLPPPRQPPAPPVPQPPQPPPPPPPPRDTVTLTYRGLFKRTDGQVLALVEDSKSGASSFYKSGATVHGVKLGEIRMDALTVTDAADAPVSLKLKQRVVFEEGKHVR